MSDAAVQALIMLPAMGIQPINNCDAVRPIAVEVIESKDARAALSESSMSKTLPSAIVIANCMGVVTALSLQGICARPAPTAPADALAE